MWTGTEMIVWGGVTIVGGGNYQYLADGGRYNPSTDTWGAAIPLWLNQRAFQPMLR